MPQHLLFMLLLLPAMATATPKPAVAISQAKWAKGVLSVKGSVRHSAAASVDVYDSSGRLLGQAPVDGKHRFAITRNDLDRPELLCSVQAKATDAAATAAVKGRPKSCSKAPQCKILSPVGRVAAAVNTDVNFSAKATLKDKKAQPLKIEWDFAGGSMGQSTGNPLQDSHTRPTGTEATVQFVRDNTRYRVRFTAWDKQNRYCEDSVEVVVGNPPDTLESFQTTLSEVKALAQSSRESAPNSSTNLAGNTGDEVVLPFEKRSMQCGQEVELMPATYDVYPVPYNTVNAYVYEKGLRPVLQGEDKVELTYAAASNPADPAGADSINSTSQNWPVGKSMLAASLKKGELWDRYQRPADQLLADGYFSSTLIESMSGYSPEIDGMHSPVPDEGAYFVGGDPMVPVNADHGRYMPGIGAPYAENQPQAFSEFSAQNNWFSANWLPLTDIDDSGRVNPTTLLRVQVLDKQTQKPVATTDVTVTSGKDFHCRECHTLGKIGANPAIKRTNTAGGTDLMLMASTSERVEDQEYAAALNMASLHWFNDVPNMNMGDMHPGKDTPILIDMPRTGCIGYGMCHGGGPTTFSPDQNKLTNNYSSSREGPGSVAMHRMHGALQYNDDKTDILRDEKGRYRCAGGDKAGCLDPNRSLFPVKDTNGNILPMEENCLKCHSGQREQCYRDRMYTAGVTCYQCHGDMLAVGQVYKKSQAGPDGNQYRMHWLDQPECGSCHTGSGNQGTDGSNGFFSAGVKTLAFAESDPAATPNAVDWTNPDTRRFAVPRTELEPWGAGQDYNPVLRSPLYRLGKDVHGQVACAACHGPAHGIWPNRAPSANDNVTALELQGHTGSLLECNVCHTADSFAKMEDNDEGIKVVDAKAGVLGGPHNLHPIFDPNWWKTAADDPGNSDGSTSGGWHNDYAIKEGHDHEDQCAACHGNDHKGTRLSKTPVDRVFDFTDLADLPALKKAGIKPKVKVKAGTPIGCDTCHSVEHSCKGSPNPTCGQASDQVTASTDLPPPLSPAVIEAVIGQDYSGQLSLTDPERDAVSISPIGPDSGEFNLDSGGALSFYAWVTQTWASNLGTAVDTTSSLPRPPFDHHTPVLLTDPRGAWSIQDLTIRLTCPEGLVWDQAAQSCMALAIYSYTPSGGLDAGPDWVYQVLTESGTHAALSYSLMDPVPPQMSIDAHGKITWKTGQVASSGPVSATIRVLDSAGNEADRVFSLTLCRSPMHYSTEIDNCVGSVQITSTPPAQTSANSYRYPVTVSKTGNKPISYSLITAPPGFSIGTDGVVTGDPSLTTLGQPNQIDFTVQAAVDPDDWARQRVYVQACPGDAPIFVQAPSESSGACTLSPITFTESNPPPASANSSYSFSVTATDNNPGPISYSLTGAPGGMSIDSQGTVSWNSAGHTGESIQFGIVASDPQGGWAQHYVNFSVCPGFKPIFDPTTNRCQFGPIRFTSVPDYGIGAKQVFHYQATTTNTNKAAVSYSLEGAPQGMAVDGNGLVSWDSAGFDGQYLEFRIDASDSLGAWTQQSLSLTVCPLNTPIWDSSQGVCGP
ncbi:MAG: hypothetical protein FIA97_04020 [Methylococcaceae bacterium]|nr:hypothetical protein [Methylococcaceae bacterium]